jgi:hypothetical protein
LKASFIDDVCNSFGLKGKNAKVTSKADHYATFATNFIGYLTILANNKIYRIVLQAGKKIRGGIGIKDVVTKLLQILKTFTLNLFLRESLIMTPKPFLKS